MDLKALLVEAKQKDPPVLQVLLTEDEMMMDIGGERGCTFCGGLGHRITDCRKLEAMQAKQKIEELAHLDANKHNGCNL